MFETIVNYVTSSSQKSAKKGNIFMTLSALYVLKLNQKQNQLIYETIVLTDSNFHSVLGIDTTYVQS